MPTETVSIGKLEAAKRQLHTAIKLWFADADQVSVHTLACSAYQIIHDINTKNKGRKLLLDSDVIKEEFRDEYFNEMRKAMRFFKHADKDPNPNGIVEFAPSITDLFILFSIIGLEQFGEKYTEMTTAFLLFYTIRNPHLVTKRVNTGIKIQDVAKLSSTSKREFLDQFFLTRQQQPSGAIRNN